tara:strand:+ start:985 stop:4962 length:3978 start_codon:yes stop_codon:yes gene_type:complete
MSIFLAVLMVSSLAIWVPSVNAADGDNDGFDDSVDDCPFAAGTSTIGSLGCPDTDLDGTPDSVDGTIADFSSASRDYDSISQDFPDEQSGGMSEYTAQGWGNNDAMVRAIDVAPNGMVALGADDGDHVYIARSSGKIVQSLFTMGSNPRALDFSPNGSLLAAAAYSLNDNMANVHVYEMNWNALMVSPVANLSSNHYDDTFGMSFSPDGTELYVGGKDNNVTIYDTSTWAVLRVIEFGEDDVYNIVSSPDGRLIAVTHGEELSVHWTSNGSQLYNVHNHSNVVLGLDWSPDGRWIITGGNDDRFRIYHAENGTMMAEVNQGSDVYGVAFNKAGTHFVLATTSGSGTSIYSTADWSNVFDIGDFPGGSGNGASGRRGARDVAWSADETKIHFGGRYYGAFYTFYSADAFIWMGGDVTGQLMEELFAEYGEVGDDYLPNHYNSSITPITQTQCNQANQIQGILMGAGATTSAEALTTKLGNYSTTGLRTCDSNGDLLVDVPVARMPATLMVKANGIAEQCLSSIGGLSMGQVRWMLSSASNSDLSNTDFHPGMDLTSIAPNDNGNGVVEWDDLDSSCANPDPTDTYPIHMYHRWENRSVPQMIEAFMFCDHCSFPDDWYEQDFDRYRLVEETRSEIISGVNGFDGAIGIVELRAGIASNLVYNIPIVDNWTHGVADAISNGESVVQPTVENSSSGDWPFQDDYYLTMREDSISEARGFVEWMLSEAGQDNFDEKGFARLDPYARVLSGDRVGLDLRSILPDDDSDGIWNGDDLCPGTDPSTAVDSTGCAQNQLDDDGDGLVNTEDDCPNQSGTSTQPTIGCPDSDGDSWADTADAFPDVSTQWSDSDGDEFGDNPEGFEADACPDVEGYSNQDRFGCLDTDGDGWSDANDMFPANPIQWIDADLDGIGDNYSCSSMIDDICLSEIGDAFPSEFSQHKDRDGDGFGDNPEGVLADNCPDQAGTSNQGDLLGCLDSDGDGWADDLDDFPDEPSQYIDSDGDTYGDSQSGVRPDNCRETPEDEILLVNERGCAPSERDGDFDGVMEDVDICPNTPEEEVFDVDPNGCSESERDTDGDGVIDSIDTYPQDASQTVDSDGDTFGDNSSGTNGDDCPSEAGTSTGNLRGCVDGDGDSWADSEDIVPNIETQWNDTDGDGYYDNFANSIWADDEMRINGSWPGQLVPGARTPDRCPLHANELQNLENPGCPEDMHPAGEDEDTGFSNPVQTSDSGGGLSAITIIIIMTVVIFVIAIGGVVALLLKKPKKKTRKREQSSQAKQRLSEPEPEVEEEISLEDDPNYKVDENGCEWWYDEGEWWYRTPEMDDWAEFSG